MLRHVPFSQPRQSNAGERLACTGAFSFPVVADLVSAIGRRPILGWDALPPGMHATEARDRASLDGRDQLDHDGTGE